jgi:hypothetical protein
MTLYISHWQLTKTYVRFPDHKHKDIRQKTTLLQISSMPSNHSFERCSPRLPSNHEPMTLQAIRPDLFAIPCVQYQPSVEILVLRSNRNDADNVWIDCVTCVFKLQIANCKALQESINTVHAYAVHVASSLNTADVRSVSYPWTERGNCTRL